MIRSLALLVLLVTAVLTSGGGIPSPVSASTAPTPILWLDASNPTSYPGTGNQWTDLSGGGRVATISAGITFDSVNQALNFPGGLNGTAFVDLGGDLGTFTGGLTIEFEGEFGTARSDWERIFDFAQGVGAPPFNSFWVGQYEGRNELAMEVWENQTQKGYCHTATDGTGLGTVGVRTFYKWVITIANDANKTCRIFRNGVEMTTRSTVSFSTNVSSAGSNATGSAFVLPPTVNRTTNFLGRSNFTADSDLEGSIRYIRIYNTALTPQQVLNNASATVTFDNNGGVGSMATQSSTVSATLNLNAFTRSNHVFASWNTVANGQGFSYNNGATFPFTADTTLYAQWNPITLTFDANGGAGSMATHSASTGFNVPANGFTRAGHSFVGWNTSANGSGTAVSDQGAFSFTANTTLYAQWAVILPPIVVPSTTTTTLAPPPSSEVPQPERLPSGEWPKVDPGTGEAFEDRREVPVDVFVESQRTLVMRGTEFELRVSGRCASDCVITDSIGGRPTIHLDGNGIAEVGGFGFEPGTSIDVWMFSDPRFLGSVEVADDGTFRGEFPVMGAVPGEHTIQVNGTSSDGVRRTANLGVVVRSVPTLPVTGSTGTERFALLAFAVGLLGLAAVARSRRPVLR